MDATCAVPASTYGTMPEPPDGNPDHIRALSAGKTSWRKWRKQHSEAPDLRGGVFRGLDLSSLDLSAADLRWAKLDKVDLSRARLQGARLDGCIARFARFSRAKMEGASCVGSDLRAASLRRANLEGADFTDSILRFTSMAKARVEGARFTRAEVYGIGAWALEGEPEDESNLVVRESEGSVATTVDRLETAQFLFLLRENDKIGDVIHTASTRTVLILGRFKPSLKRVLDGLADVLLDNNFVPVIFHFDRPEGRNLTETVASLAHMACFVVPDLTGAKSVPQELSFIVPFLPSVPVCPILARRQRDAWSMYEHFERYPWVQPVVRYDDLEHLKSIARKEIIEVGWNAAMKSRGADGRPLPPIPPTRRARGRRR